MIFQRPPQIPIPTPASDRGGPVACLSASDQGIRSRRGVVGIPLVENKNVFVSWYLGFFVSWFQSVLVSWFQRLGKSVHVSTRYLFHFNKFPFRVI